MAQGPVAQLNRVSDSGSEGSGFEPQRGHKSNRKDEKVLQNLHNSKNCSTFARFFAECEGKMAEWSIASVLKTEVLKGTGGSNPSLSANKTKKLSV